VCSVQRAASQAARFGLRMTQDGPQGNKRRISVYNSGMGGERSSTTRMRLAGKICCNCKVSLPQPHSPGEHFCARCAASRTPRHRVYMSFMHREGWHCQFLEEDLKTSLPRKVTLDTPAKLIEMAKRGGSNLNLETRQALDHGIEIGRGGVWLDLTEDQYARLRRR
jgi:hypothetical protein